MSLLGRNNNSLHIYKKTSRFWGACTIAKERRGQHRLPNLHSYGNSRILARVWISLSGIMHLFKVTFYPKRNFVCMRYLQALTHVVLRFLRLKKTAITWGLSSPPLRLWKSQIFSSGGLVCGESERTQLSKQPRTSPFLVILLPTIEPTFQAQYHDKNKWALRHYLMGDFVSRAPRKANIIKSNPFLERENPITLRRCVTQMGSIGSQLWLLTLACR